MDTRLLSGLTSRADALASDLQTLRSLRHTRSSSSMLSTSDLSSIPHMLDASRDSIPQQSSHALPSAPSGATSSGFPIRGHAPVGSDDTRLQLSRLRGELAALQDSDRECRTAKSALMVQLREKDGIIALSDAELRSKSEEVLHLRSALQREQDTSASMRKRIVELEAHVSHSQSVVGKLQGELTGCNARLELCQRELSQANAAVSDSSHSLGATASRVAALENASSSCRRELETCELRLANEKRTSADTTSRFQALKESHAQLTYQLGDLRSSRTEVEQRLEECQQRECERNEEVKLLRAQLTAARATAAKLSAASNVNGRSAQARTSLVQRAAAPATSTSRRTGTASVSSKPTVSFVIGDANPDRADRKAQSGAGAGGGDDTDNPDDAASLDSLQSQSGGAEKSALATPATMALLERELVSLRQRNEALTTELTATQESLAYMRVLATGPGSPMRSLEGWEPIVAPWPSPTTPIDADADAMSPRPRTPPRPATTRVTRHTTDSKTEDAGLNEMTDAVEQSELVFSLQSMVTTLTLDLASLRTQYEQLLRDSTTQRQQLSDSVRRANTRAAEATARAEEFASALSLAKAAASAGVAQVSNVTSAANEQIQAMRQQLTTMAAARSRTTDSLNEALGVRDRFVNALQSLLPQVRTLLREAEAGESEAITLLHALAQAKSTLASKGVVISGDGAEALRGIAARNRTRSNVRAVVVAGVADADRVLRALQTVMAAPSGGATRAVSAGSHSALQSEATDGSRVGPSRSATGAAGSSNNKLPGVPLPYEPTGTQAASGTRRSQGDSVPFTPVQGVAILDLDTFSVDNAFARQKDIAALESMFEDGVVHPTVTNTHELQVARDTLATTGYSDTLRGGKHGASASYRYGDVSVDDESPDGAAVANSELSSDSRLVQLPSTHGTGATVPGSSTGDNRGRASAAANTGSSTSQTAVSTAITLTATDAYSTTAVSTRLDQLRSLVVSKQTEHDGDATQRIASASARSPNRAEPERKVDTDRRGDKQDTRSAAGSRQDEPTAKRAGSGNSNVVVSGASKPDILSYEPVVPSARSTRFIDPIPKVPEVAIPEPKARFGIRVSQVMAHLNHGVELPGSPLSLASGTQISALSSEEESETFHHQPGSGSGRLQHNFTPHTKVPATDRASAHAFRQEPNNVHGSSGAASGVPTAFSQALSRAAAHDGRHPIPSLQDADSGDSSGTRDRRHRMTPPPPRQVRAVSPMHSALLERPTYINSHEDTGGGIMRRATSGRDVHDAGHESGVSQLDVSGTDRSVSVGVTTTTTTGHPRVHSTLSGHDHACAAEHLSHAGSRSTTAISLALQASAARDAASAAEAQLYSTVARQHWDNSLLAGSGSTTLPYRGHEQDAGAHLTTTTAATPRQHAHGTGIHATSSSKAVTFSPHRDAGVLPFGPGSASLRRALLHPHEA